MIMADVRRAGPLSCASRRASALMEDLRVMNLADELQKLQQLHQSGAINDDEFTLAKAKLLNGSTVAQPFASAPSEATWVDPETQEKQTRQWAFLLHLSIWAGFVLPVAGLAVPIAIWQLKKSDLPGIDQHGKNAVNWIISKLIYFVICLVLCFVIIGIPLLIALGAVGVIFPLIAAIKANNGEVWKYPMAITFVK
jgi:uncharacterized Tic20 family protein